MKKKVLVIAGGTGGHIFPALSVADRLAAQDVDIAWLGSQIGLEKSLIPEHYPITYVSAKRIRGKGWKTYLLSPFYILLTIWQAWKVMISQKPDLVLAMGGFVSGPGGLAAKLAGKKLVIHEQNAVAGYSNKVLSLFADAILVAYPNVFPHKQPPQVIGNPVRPEMVDAAIDLPNRVNSSTPLRVFVLGGSQGAHGLNECILNFIKDFAHNQQLEWWHQTGKQDYTTVLETYATLQIKAKVEPFIHHIVEAYRWADLVICRAGALTLAELTCAGLPSILVPFPAAVDDHQWCNGDYLAKANAAILIREKELTPERLTDLMNRFLKDRSLLMQMAHHARQLAKPDATDRAANLILQLLNRLDARKQT
jgi:UDP-N-acetylglucosamine--N-acetylmuramyl-(pentapeptide) pyrophosphoryl-undecaprenol N-acetylglucosamine transferase